MTDKDWEVMQHFSPDENWGEPNRMSSELVYELDAYREFIGKQIFVSCGTNKSHKRESQHPHGLAVDIMFPGHGVLDLVDLFHAALRFGFKGIGLYNHWRYDGEVIGGMHLDWRIARHRALWLGVLEPDPKVGLPSQVYKNVSMVELRKYGFVDTLGR